MLKDLFPINKFNPVFIQVLYAFYIGIYLL